MRKLIILGTVCAICTSCSAIRAGEVEIPSEPTTASVVETVESVEIEPPKVLVEVSEPIIEESSEIGIIEEEPSTEFRVTAYCACEVCCGQWALNRPLDDFGKPIVIGAANKPLTAGVSCASPLPFGTEVELDGYGTVVVEDRTANWVVEKYGQNIVDIYFDDHETARQFGLQYIEGVIR